MSGSSLPEPLPDIAGDAVRVIKRYPNRKLYDQHARAFTSLARLRDLVRSGREIKVVSHDTGEDITGETLSKLLPTRGVTTADAGVLTSLIRTPGRVAQSLVGREEERDELRRVTDEVRSLSRALDALLDSGRS